jgi:hypothetical protein
MSGKPGNNMVVIKSAIGEELDRGEAIFRDGSQPDSP